MIENVIKHLPAIDFHTHFALSPVTHFIPEARGLPSFTQFMQALDAARVTEAVLLCGPKKGAMRKENETLAERVFAVQHRFKLVAWLNPKHDTPNDLQELVENNNFCGLKLHPVFDQYQLTDPAVKPFIEKAIKLDVPILIHTGWGSEGRVEDIGILAEEFSDGTFICLHMKEEFGLNERYSHLELAAHNQNVFLECSYIPHPRRLAETVDIIGPERILFGSDYPWGARDISWEKTKVTNADISVEAMKQILSVNARELLKL